MALQAGTAIIVTAANTGGTVQSGFSLTLADVPQQMSAPAVTADTPTQVTITPAPAPSGNNAPVTATDLRYRANGAAWNVLQDITAPVVLDLFAEADLVEAQTRARNSIGAAPWSAPGSATTPLVPPAAAGGLADRSFSEQSGLRSYDITGDFTGTGLSYSITPVPGVSIDPVNGVVIFDTDILLPQAGTAIIVTATNTAGAAQSGFSLTVTAIPVTFGRVVFVGASIMRDLNPVANLTQRNTNFEAAFAAEGALVEVYAAATAGALLSDTVTELSAAMTAFPDDTLFFVHAGGNNISANRPYPGGAGAIAADLDALIDVAANRPGSVIISDLTFRDYDDMTAADESAGAKPYNDAVYLPAFRTRADALLGRAYYTDGTPVSCLYEWTYHNRAGYLSSDNVHPTNAGVTALRTWLAARLAPVVINAALPAQETRVTLGDVAPVLSQPSAQPAGPATASLSVVTNEAGGVLNWAVFDAAASPDAAAVIAGSGAVLSGVQPVTAPGVQGVPDQPGLPAGTAYRAHFVQTDSTGNRSLVVTSASFTTAAAAPGATGIDLFVQYGNNTASGVNTPGFTLPTDGLSGDGPFALLNGDGGDPGVTLTLAFSAPSPGGSGGFGINTSGRSTGISGFDGTLYNNVFTTDSYFVGASYTVDHILSGLVPDTAYTVELVASRAASGSRETLFTFANGETATIETTANPVEAVAVVNTLSDSTGTITITQSANSGSWSYLGGLRLYGAATAVQGLTVENIGEEPVITVTSAGALSVTISAGTYAGTYTQRATDGAPLTTAMIEAAEAAGTGVPIVLPVVSGTETEGFTLTATPGVWIYAGADLGDPDFAWVNTASGATGDTDLFYTLAATDVGDRLRFTETYGSASIDSADTGVIATGSPVPDAFTAADWSVATGPATTRNSLTITVTALPADNGNTVTDIEYDIGADNLWRSLGLSTAGSADIEMALFQTAYDIRLRAVNTSGAGPEGETQSATSGAGLPNEITDWAPSTGRGAAEVDITVNTLPSGNGSPITGVEWRVLGGTWAATGLAAAATATVVLPASATEYDIEVRAVNAVGNGPESAPETVESGAAPAAIDPEAGLILSFSQEVGASRNWTNGNRQNPAVLAMDFTGLTAAEGLVVAAGDGTFPLDRHFALYINGSGQLVVVSGSHTTEVPDTLATYLTAPAPTGDGTLVVELSPTGGAPRAWWNGVPLASGVAQSTGLPVTEIAGGADAVYLDAANAPLPVGRPGPVATDVIYTTASALRFYQNQTVTG
jgi:hypothetical protein